MYRYIMQIELAFITRYKMDPFALFGCLTTLDLHTYVNAIELQLEEDRKQRGDGKDLGQMLAGLRDYLIYMLG